jgi:hypothetical protein
MQNKNPLLSLAITLVVLFIFFIGLTNTLITSYVNDPGIFKKRHENIAAIPLGPVKTLLKEPKDNILISEDPARYNIQVLTDKDLSLSQAQWDVNMRTALLHSKTARPVEGRKKSPKELKERLDRINRQIKDLEKTGPEGSGNQTEEMKLQSLYILKSSLTILEETPGEKIPKRK